MKIGPLSIIFVGLCIGVSVLSFAWFKHWVPNRKQAQLFVERTAEHETVMLQMPAAIKKVQEAEALVAAKKEEWKRISAARSLPGTKEQGGIDLGVHRWQLAMDIPHFRNRVQQDLNRQLKQGGVRVVQGPRIPDPPADPNAVLSYFNYPAMPYPVLIFDFGQVTVTGTYKQITDHLRAWSRMPRYLAVTDRLALQGTSPTLTGTYNLSIVSFIQSREVSPAVPSGGAGGGGGPAPRGRMGGG